MSAALAAQGFCAQHPQAAVGMFGNGLVIDGLVKAGPATAGIKLGVVIKQGLPTANTLVAASLPMGFIFAAERALGRRLPGDRKGQGFGPLVSQVLFPLGIGFLDFHEEQLMAMELAQSGGNPARWSASGCSSKGWRKIASKLSTSLKSPAWACRIAVSPK
jgi:hypothetical protein